MPTLINVFEVAQGVDDEFVAEWKRARDFLLARKGYVDTALHRSLAPQAEFRFVNVARVDALERWLAIVSDSAFPRHLPATPNPALFEVVREDETGAGDAHAVLINPFEVPAGEDEAFLAAWEGARETMRDADGYLGTRLYGSVAPDARFRFVNVAPWRSPDDFQAALRRPGFQEAASAMRFPAHPALYEVVAR